MALDDSALLWRECFPCDSVTVVAAALGVDPSLAQLTNLLSTMFYVAKLKLGALVYVTRNVVDR